MLILYKNARNVRFVLFTKTSVANVEPWFSNILLNCRFSTDDTSCTVKLEFTCLLLVVSTCFIALNLPYFVVWCMRVYNQLSAGTAGPASSAHLRGTLYISKTIFSFNYCINFFLYSMTGVNFRRQLKILFSRSRNKGKAPSKTQYSQISITNTSATPRPSITHSGVSSVWCHQNDVSWDKNSLFQSETDHKPFARWTYNNFGNYNFHILEIEMRDSNGHFIINWHHFCYRSCKKQVRRIDESPPF